jgi:hypothetical protein
VNIDREPFDARYPRRDGIVRTLPRLSPATCWRPRQRSTSRRGVDARPLDARGTEATVPGWAGAGLTLRPIRLWPPVVITRFERRCGQDGGPPAR